MTLLTRFAWATWAGLLLTLVVFNLFWRWNYLTVAWPWALGSIVIVGGAAVATVVLGLRRAIKGPGRIMAIAVVLLGTTPVVWTGALLVDQAYRAQHREPMAMSRPLRFTHYWISSVIDLEARWRYPRWTEGRHVILIDDGMAGDSQQLVRDMDAHVEAMAAVLGETSVPMRVRWVRGSLVGQDGRAVGVWAICRHEDNETSLAYLDRHETAHCVINTICGPDLHAPAVLSEGWAETQSRDRDEQIVALANANRRGVTRSLAEMIEPDFYSRSAGPAYSIGGPLVNYLIERYGAAKFLALYRTATPDTFSAVCERTLGASWSEIEMAFWKWVDDEYVRIGPPPKQPAKVELADGVEPARWQAVVDSYRSAQRTQDLPTDAAFVIDTRFTDTRGTVQTSGTSRLRAIIRDGQIWLHGEASIGDERCVMLTPRKSGVLWRGEGLVSEHRVGGAEMKGAAHDAAFDALGFYGTPADPALWLPLSGNRPSRPTRIVRITPGEDRWTIDYTQGADAELTATTIELDPRFDWHVTRISHAGVDGYTYNVRSTLQRLPDGTIAVAESDRVHQGKENGGRIESRLRAMSDDEKRELKTTVETMLRKRWSARSMLMHPEIIGTSWPAAGALMLAMARYTSTRSKRTRPSTLRAK